MVVTPQKEPFISEKYYILLEFEILEEKKLKKSQTWILVVFAPVFFAKNVFLQTSQELVMLSSRMFHKNTFFKKKKIGQCPHVPWEV